MSTRTVVDDRRKQGRFSAGGSAALKWPGFSGEEYATRGRVRDVSARGMSIRMHEPLSVGQKVRVRLYEADYPARIRRCRADGTGFLAGVEIVINDPGERWAWLHCRDFSLAQEWAS